MHCCNRARCCGAFGTGGRDASNLDKLVMAVAAVKEKRWTPGESRSRLTTECGIVAELRSPRTCQDTRARRDLLAWVSDKGSIAAEQVGHPRSSVRQRP